MSTYIPDSWVVLKITTPEETIYKILASWKGSYLHGDSWKVSSGVTDAIDFEGYYEFPQYSGSLYVCRANAEGLSIVTAGLLSMWQSQVMAEGLGSIVEISVKNFMEEWNGRA